MSDTFALDRYSAAVFDLDGTVWLSGVPIEGAVEFVESCRALGMSVTFATNATAIDVDPLAAQLLACALARPGDAVITGGSVVARTLSTSGVEEVAAVAPPAMVAAIRTAGIAVCEVPVDVWIGDEWTTPAPERALVMGASRSATFGSVERIGYLASIGHPLYMSSLDPFYPALGRLEPGGGMLATAARALYDVDPIVLGKPSQPYADAVRATVADGPIVMFGDSQRADVGTAKLLGADSVLVRTAARPDLAMPDYVALSLAGPITIHEEES